MDFNLCLSIGDPGELAAALRDQFDVGFAFEGAGMYVALFDLLTPGGRAGCVPFTAARDHDAIVAVGAGFAVARLPRGRRLWPR